MEQQDPCTGTRDLARRPSDVAQSGLAAALFTALAASPRRQTQFGRRLLSFLQGLPDGLRGDPVVIAAYFGSSDTFDKAAVEFAKRDAVQNLSDYEAFEEAIASGALESVGG